MASVTYSNARKYRYLGEEEEEALEKPQSNTLREKILKELLERQLSTSTSLDKQYQNQRKFTKSSVEESITASTSGLTTCEDYKNVEFSLNVKQTLTSSGLTNAEIHVLLSEDEESSSLEAPQAREHRLREIENKLLRRQDQLRTLTDAPEQFNGAVPLNRHEFEEECNVVLSTPQAEKLTSCLIRLQPHQDQTLPPDHPINHIQSLAEELFPGDTEDKTPCDPSPKKLKRRKTHVEKQPDSSEQTETKFIYLTDKPHSFWDMQEIPKVVKTSIQNQEMLPTSQEVCQGKEVLCTVKRKGDSLPVLNQTQPFVLTLDTQDLLSLEAIASNRKSIHELRSLEKFKNYNPGQPSPTLYIKNLSHKTSPQDLASLMGNFECCGGPKIKYRILGGRMRGQAFVTFPDAEVATTALSTCNGYIMHEKPLVIEFGKKKV